MSENSRRRDRPLRWIENGSALIVVVDLDGSQRIFARDALPQTTNINPRHRENLPSACVSADAKVRAAPSAPEECPERL
jgi:predicted RNA-binding protein (virulence factor B family)